MRSLSLKRLLLAAIFATAFNNGSHASLPGDHKDHVAHGVGGDNCSQIGIPTSELEEVLAKARIDRLVSFLEYEQGVFAERLVNSTPGERASPIMADVVDDHCRKVIFNGSGYPGSEFLKLSGYSNADLHSGKAERLYAECLRRWEVRTKLGARIQSIYPIGYNIYLPTTTPKATFVEVYGGGGHEYYTKVILSNFHQVLLSRGVAVVTLNTIDLLEFKDYKCDQGIMPEDIYNKVHNSINTFYVAFNKNPESIDPELSCFKNLPIYLSGFSFGGMVTVRHAELRPHTFDGYISCCGGLGADKPGWYYDRVKSPYQVYVSKEQEIAKIAKPILILHNRNDSNVNVEESNDWVIKARKVLGVHAKIQAFYISRFIPNDDNMAHGEPIEEDAFWQYTDSVSQFILSGPSKILSLTDWRIHTQALYADKFRRLSTAEEKFLYVAFRFYKSHLHLADLQEADNVLPTTIGFGNEQAKLASWKKYYEPLFYIIHYFEQAIRLPDRKIIEANRSFKDRMWSSLKSDLELCAWDSVVKQLNINELQDTLKTASDESAKKTLRVVLPLYLSFLNKPSDEINKLWAFVPSLNKLELEKLLTPELLDNFKLSLCNGQNKFYRPSYRARYMMVISHFMANTELIADKYVEIESMPGFHEGLGQARIAFDKAVQLDRLMTKTVLSECLRLAVRQVKVDKAGGEGAGDK